MNVNIDGLVKAVMNELSNYHREVTADMKEDIQQIAKETAKELKNTSPKRTGAYAKSWTSKKAYEDSLRVRNVVHNKDHYQLTHLLEHGHATRDGSKRTTAYPHIKPAEDKAEKKLLTKIQGHFS